MPLEQFLIRYGENAETVAALNDWICPRCRGICNCSFCMKKRGSMPTGRFVHVAKANGFSSVSDMLHLHSEETGIAGTDPEKQEASKKESVTDLAERELEQKNWMSETKPLKTKGKRVGTRSNELSVSGISNSGENKSTGNKDDLFSENSSLKHDISKMSWEEKEEVYTQDDGTQLVKMGTDLKIVKRNSAESVENEHSQVEFTNIDDDDDVIEIIDTDDDTMKHKRAKVSNHYKKKKNMVKVKQRAANINTPLPQGIILKKAALTGLPPEDVSHASRFLEFCEAVAQEPEAALTGKCVKENSLERQNDLKMQDKPLKMNGKEIKITNNKLKRLGCNREDENRSRGNGADSFSLSNSPLKFQIPEVVSEEKEKVCTRNESGQSVKMNTDLKILERSSGKSIKNGFGENEMANSVDVDHAVTRCKQVEESHYYKIKSICKFKSKVSDIDIPRPEGILLKSVASIDLCPEDVGHALQFLEFCEAFGQVLNLNKGQPELLLQELADGQSIQQSHSAIVQFHIQLLSVILKNSGKEFSCLNQLDDNSWLQALVKYLSESQHPLKELQLDCFDVGGDGYDHLDSSKKLRLLNFLCDEALGTKDFRNWIDEQCSKFVQREKEEEKVIAEKEKVRSMKKKLQNEIAKAVLMKNVVPLSIAEHEDLLLKIKLEVAKALEVVQTLAGTLEPTNAVLQKEHRSDAVRSEPILFDGHGGKFWRLKGYTSEMDILLQDLEEGDFLISKERWYAYDIGQKAAVENYMSSFRKQRK
ncbi:uncharacterized protein LOC110820426 isoform X2 [Carica papaya]|uniref:uncharacterized protein LOC110820426 isoform X2 n=1 Tax=Carica papaya TaxID=3649 RepID=UPI000B8C7C2A|nr:uncharacterized protein LOC110820426 isoform X2 [Carica papaya]XP_021905576.1 uncharacterized protein LOC110820426 isoform X2 [Carica papaya]